MTGSQLTISKATQRQFILGLQGLYPGRRWRGRAGVIQALRAGCVVQIDPLCIIARSHDIALYGRVLDYQPEFLNSVLYEDRAGFDWGGTVTVNPMDELPYWRVVMARKGEQRAYLGEQNQSAMAEVLAALQERGALSNRDFAAPPGEKKYWHAAKTTAQALYYLWLKGDVMTHSRRGFERLFDLRERVAPAQWNYTAPVEEAENYFALKVLHQLGCANLRGWRSGFSGTIERKVSMEEAAARLDALVAGRQVVEVRLEEAPQNKLYVLASNLPFLEELQAGRLPDAWQPLESVTDEEMVFLAPLEIVSARGRAKTLFDFEYVWEVYKPVETRRWGYYTLPILYGDRLVARFDSKLDRSTRTLQILGFWQEPGAGEGNGYQKSLARGFERFARFIGAESIMMRSTI